MTEIARALVSAPAKIIDNTTYDRVIVEKEARRQYAAKAISDFIWKIKEKNKVTIQSFYFLHINHFCEVPDKGYIPAEIAVCEWNIENGIKRTWHSFIDPGLNAIPTGYDSAMREWRDETHKINYPVKQELEPQTKIEVFNHLVNFLKCSGEGSYPPPVFVYYNLQNTHTVVNIEALVDDVLQKLSQEAGSHIYFRVFPLTKLFFQLRNACAEMTNGTGFVSENDAVVELEKDEYQQRTTLACEYHVKADAVAFCSLSHVKRWAYGVLQRCCHDAGIEMVRGRHFPEAPKLVIIEETANNFWKRRPDMDNFRSSSTSVLPKFQELEKPATAVANREAYNNEAGAAFQGRNHTAKSHKESLTETEEEDHCSDDWQRVSYGKRRVAARPLSSSLVAKHMGQLTTVTDSSGQRAANPYSEHNSSSVVEHQNLVKSLKEPDVLPEGKKILKHTDVENHSFKTSDEPSYSLNVQGNRDHRPDHEMISQPAANAANVYTAFQTLKVEVLKMGEEMKKMQSLVTEHKNLQQEVNTLKLDMKKLQTKFEKDLDVLVKANEYKDEELKKLRNQIAEDVYQSSEDEMESLPHPMPNARRTFGPPAPYAAHFRGMSASRGMRNYPYPPSNVPGLWHYDGPPMYGSRSWRPNFH